jgi:DNA invertase Pin-like site-specific DNA recombinase
MVLLQMMEVIMAGIAFSYLRFSTPEQAAGDSRRRQLAMAEKYAADHHLKLDRQLSFRDLGVSAFRGKNAKEGALRAFLDAIEHNLVPQGSFLLIESLDRLSRNRILAAQTLFLQIIQAGVTIVTLVDQRSYSQEGINQNPLDLIISLVSMMRANEESEMKSRRIRAAFDIKRAGLAERPWSSRCPGWLRLDKPTRKFVIVEERADVVRRIFRDVLAGVGHQTIVRQLNEEQVPLFGHGNQRGKIWQKATIRHLIYTPTVIGIHVPFVTEWVDNIRRVRPQTPVQGYYPAIIERADWDGVQAKRAAWLAHYHNDVPKTGRANLLAGLSRCPYCDRSLVLLSNGNPNWRYYMCRRAFNGTGCSDRWIRYAGIEDALTIDIAEIIKSCPKPALTSDARRHRLRYIRDRLHILRERRSSMAADYSQLSLSRRPLVAARDNVVAEIDALMAERKRLRIDRPKWLDVTLAARLDKLQTVATASIVDRHELHALFRSLFTKVVVDWEYERLVFHWQHGGDSNVRAMMNPQRVVANVRRADRLRFQPGEMAVSLPVVER